MELHFIRHILAEQQHYAIKGVTEVILSQLNKDCLFVYPRTKGKM